MKRVLKITAISVAVVIAGVVALYMYAYGDFIWRAEGDKITAATMVLVLVWMLLRWRRRRVD